jgi:hypothetical protein
VQRFHAKHHCLGVLNDLFPTKSVAVCNAFGERLSALDELEYLMKTSGLLKKIDKFVASVFGGRVIIYSTLDLLLVLNKPRGPLNKFGW